MENDFHEHLDTARLWWDLDDAVLQAIAEGRSTREPFRALALYVLELKARAATSGATDHTAALTKIAIRVAGVPELVSPTPSLTSRRKYSRARLVAIVALMLVGLVGLLAAAAAANVITLPMPIEKIFNKVGIPIHSESSGRSSKEHEAEFAAPTAPQHSGSGAISTSSTAGSIDEADGPPPGVVNAENEQASPPTGHRTDEHAPPMTDADETDPESKGDANKYGSKSEKERDKTAPEKGEMQEKRQQPTPKETPEPRQRGNRGHGGDDPEETP